MLCRRYLNDACTHSKHIDTIESPNCRTIIDAKFESHEFNQESVFVSFTHAASCPNIYTVDDAISDRNDIRFIDLSYIDELRRPRLDEHNHLRQP